MRVLNQQFTDSLRDDRYPFLGTGPVHSGNLVLPADCFLDLNLMVDDERDDGAFLSHVTCASGKAVFMFLTGAGTLVGTLDLDDADSAGQVQVKRGTLITGYARVDLNAAQIVKGWPSGTHEFVGVEVIPHLLVISDRRWRRGFGLPDGTVLEGSVYLVADVGLWFERTATGFKLHCTGNPFDGRTGPSRGLKTLSGAAPDTNGNINLVPQGTGGHAFRLSVTPGKSDVLVELIGAKS